MCWYEDMFTGLIEGIGRVIESGPKRIVVRLPFARLKKGESIAVDGVCLTATAPKGRTAAFDVGSVTRRITTLGTLRRDQPVNIERAMRMGDRFGGHLVSGHVEARGTLRRWRRQGKNWLVTIQIPAGLRRWVVAKGSLAVDGISLTVAGLRKNFVEIMIIPHTYQHTTLRWKKPGDAVNLETDLLAKYALR